MILFENVSKDYPLGRQGRVPALCEAQLHIEPGEFLVITGRSGSGKTTLLNLAAGLTPPSAGRVLFAGQDLWRMSETSRAALRRAQIGFIFQFPSLLPGLSVLENVLLPGVFGAHPPGLSASGREHGSSPDRAPAAYAAHLLDSLGLADKLQALPRQLSAGQQQRAVIARALFNRPAVLLADEPTSDLDEQTEIEIMELFARLHRQEGLTIVLVTHSTQLVCYSTRAIRMAGGRICAPESAGN
ncbi:MAG: ABC transporter ATP-binding protein [Chloroflexota bacterium]